MAQTLRLYEATPKIEAGQLAVPDKPGLGLVFDQAAMKRYQVGSVVRAGSGPA
jgi:L-alanine-DL-glutamate epimerase-like enolase superfamily enzyme